MSQHSAARAIIQHNIWMHVVKILKMKFILSLGALSFLVVAFAAPDPVEDLRFEVQALTNMVTQQQAELASLKADVRNSVSNIDFPVDEHDMAEQPIRSLISSTSALTDRLAELERRLADDEDQIETLQSNIDSFRNEVGDATKAADSNFEPVGETNLRQTVFGYVNDSLNQLRMEGNGLGIFPIVPRCQSGTIGTKFYNGIKYSYPRTYDVDFKPPFRAIPRFTYGMIHLDSDAIVRVDVTVESLTPRRATIVVGTWYTKHLLGAEISWMACP